MRSQFWALRWVGCSAHLAEAVRFGLVGLVNTTATLVVIYILMLAGVDMYVSNVFGYGAGLMISFALNRQWTFRVSERLQLRMVALFLAATVAAYGANLLTVYLVANAGLDPYLAQLSGMPVYTVCFFLLCKFLVFRRGATSRPQQAMQRGLP